MSALSPLSVSEKTCAVRMNICDFYTPARDIRANQPEKNAEGREEGGMIGGVRVEEIASLPPWCKFDGDFFKMAARVSCVFLMLITPHDEARLLFWGGGGLTQR